MDGIKKLNFGVFGVSVTLHVNQNQANDVYKEMLVFYITLVRCIHQSISQGVCIINIL